MIRHAFRSGMSRGNDLRAAIEAKVPVGVVAGELNLGSRLFTIPKYLGAGGAVFIDSGAFSELKTKEVPDFPRILQQYLDIAEDADWIGADLANLYVVAPDKVGCQTTSLERLKAWREHVRRLIDQGVQVIVPIQRGDKSPNEMIKATATILGTDRFIAGVPSNAEAMSIAECATMQHHSFHILGRVQKNEEQLARIAALQLHQPDAAITADANWLRSRLDQVCRATDQKRVERMRQGGLQRVIDASRTRAIVDIIKSDTAWGNLTRGGT